MDTLIMGTPAWMWAGFFVVVLALLVLDLGVLNRNQREIGTRQSLLLSAGYIGLGVAFGGLVWWQLGPAAGLSYLTGFVIEKSLAIDNVFVIAMIFGAFAIPRVLQHRVLFWGVLGVIVLRGIMIGVGAALVAQFAWLLDVFAVFLIFTGIKMLLSSHAPADPAQNRVVQFIRRFIPVSDKLHGQSFIVREPDAAGQMRRVATPLLLALLVVEAADVLFAVDSIPAIFAITTDPFLVYTSNIFAILGLRALYFALAAVLHRFAELRYALAVLLIFIGSKVFAADLLGLEKVPPVWSLGITFVILAAGIAVSLWRTRAGASQPG